MFVTALTSVARVFRAPLTTPRTTPRPSPTARTGPTTAPARCSGEPDTAADTETIAPQKNGSPRVFVLYPYTTLPPPAPTLTISSQSYPMYVNYLNLNIKLNRYLKINAFSTKSKVKSYHKVSKTAKTFQEGTT